jgi:hypothetical protein
MVGAISAFVYARENFYLVTPGKFWISLTLSNLLGWLFLSAASRRLEKFTELVSSPYQGRWWQKVFQSNFFFGKRRRLRALLEKNPILWLLNDSPRLQLTIWTLTTIGCALLVGCGYAEFADGPELIYAAKPVYFGLQLLFAIQACRFFADSRRDGTLEIIATTPLTDSIVYYGQAAALLQQFLWPVVALMAVEFTCVCGLAIAGSGGDVMTLLFLLPWQLLSCAAEFYAVAWFAMWLALTSNKPQSAAGWTVLFVLILPELAFCIPSFFISLAFILVCQHKLRRDFRLVFADAEARRR